MEYEEYSKVTFLQRTIDFLKEHNKTPKDIGFVVIKPSHYRPADKWQLGDWDDFAILADRTYPTGFTIRGDENMESDNIDDGLMLVGGDFWLERHYNDEFDSAWWEYKTIPGVPNNADPLKPFIRERYE